VKDPINAHTGTANRTCLGTKDRTPAWRPVGDRSMCRSPEQRRRTGQALYEGATGAATIPL
jgi:hypothetical protein